MEAYLHTERRFGEVSPALLADIVELDEKNFKLTTPPETNPKKMAEVAAQLHAQIGVVTDLVARRLHCR